MFGLLKQTGFVALLAFALSACGSPPLDGSSKLSKRALVDAAHEALTHDDCAGAVSMLKDTYNSTATDNDIRMAMAAAYACHAKFKLFQMASDLAANSASLPTGEFWSLMSQLFPSTVSDRIVEGALLSQDALMAATPPGWPVIPTNQFNTGTNNPGSMDKNDRITDANFYLIFMSMAGIGGIETRFGNPDPITHHKGNRLPWRTVATMDADGCAYAASIINMVDALQATSANVTGPLATSLSQISAAFAVGIGTACDIGCRNLDPDAVGPWQASGCATSTACAGCPMTLRSRDTCAAAIDNAPCAAAGLVNWINDDPLGFGWP